jgi:hypothetical protein
MRHLGFFLPRGLGREEGQLFINLQAIGVDDLNR